MNHCDAISHSLVVDRVSDPSCTHHLPVGGPVQRLVPYLFVNMHLNSRQVSSDNDFFVMTKL